jgi:ribosomal protein L31
VGVVIEGYGLWLLARARCVGVAIDEDSKKHPHYTEEEAGVLDERKVSHWLKAV